MPAVDWTFNYEQKYDAECTFFFPIEDELLSK
jgi:hypothetical protein